MPHFILGTAGHIDHGKTALVKALSGVDTDRLLEEKKRGLTIDLGFAHLGDKATIIDVPGHEKFIRNMVAGVSTIDLVLFVVAADDGVMPQTREHLDILKILQIKHGIIVLTKVDLVEEDWLGLVREEVDHLVQGCFLEKAPVVAVSSVTGHGISDLKATLESKLAQLSHKRDRGIFWMPIDRAFIMKGFGTVVTGSVLSGESHVGASLELLPQKKTVRIRGLQTHNDAVSEVTAGDRAAINLQAVERQQIRRGDVLAEPNYFVPSQRFDARLQLLASAPKAIQPNARVRLHFGTTEVMARISIYGVSKIEPGKSAYVQFHLERPATARRLDPFVIRRYSPTITIGGGVILDANARRRKLSDPGVIRQLETLEMESPQEVLEQKLLSADFKLLTLDKLTSEIGASKAEVEKIVYGLEKEHMVHTLKKDGQTAAIHANNLNKFIELFQNRVAKFHKENPARIGLSKSQIQSSLSQKIDMELLDYVLTHLKANRVIKERAGLICLGDHNLELTPEQKRLRTELEQTLFAQGFATSSAEELAEKCQAESDLVQEVLSYMISMDEIIRVEGNIYFHSKRVTEAKEKLVAFLDKNQELTVSQFKDLLGGVSRKYALPLLIYFDGMGITERVGDVRVLGNL